MQDTMLVQVMTQVSNARTIIEFFSELEGQDQGLIIELTVIMLTDIEVSGHIGNIDHYVRRYCDVLDNEDQTTQMIDEIRRELS